MCGLACSRPEDFRDEQVLEEIARDWQARLTGFVTDLPSSEQCVAVLRALLPNVLL